MASEQTPASPIHPLRIKQALIGWSSEKSDRSILDYVDMVSQWAQIESAFLLHVVPRFEDLLPYEGFSQPGLELGVVRVKAMKQAVEERIRAADRIFWEYEVREGNVSDEIALTASDLQADLVCIGRMERVSLAPDLARTLPRSLLVIPGAFRPRIARILVGIDFSEPSARALRHAVALADRLAGPVSIVCLHLYRVPEPGYTARKTHRRKEQAFQTFLERCLPDGCTGLATEALPAQEGDISAALSRYAREGRFDLVVIGARKRADIEQPSPGSVAEPFIRNTPDIAIWVLR